MSRNLLHKTKLDAFKAWLDAHPNLEWRNTEGQGNGYCVMQVRSKSGGWNKAWLGVYRRDHMPQHYTVDCRLEATVRPFLASARALAE